MKCYAGIDLHSTNSYVVVMGEDQKVLYDKRLPNHLFTIEQALEPYAKTLEGVVVESTYNWYWLADGLIKKDYKVHLAHTGSLDNYQRLKHSDDKTDARWLANLLRLRVLPTGYIYPRGTAGAPGGIAEKDVTSSPADNEYIKFRGNIKSLRGNQTEWEKIASLNVRGIPTLF